jgi:hypothetical protein
MKLIGNGIQQFARGTSQRSIWIHLNVCPGARHHLRYSSTEKWASLTLICELESRRRCVMSLWPLAMLETSNTENSDSESLCPSATCFSGVATSPERMFSVASMSPRFSTSMQLSSDGSMMAASTSSPSVGGDLPYASHWRSVRACC